MSSILSSISTYLPQHEGILPKWLLFVSILSVANSVQAYSTLTYTQRVYCGTTFPRTTHSSLNSSSKSSPAYPSTSPVTPLSARTFGTWTFLSAIIRFYAAYNITNGPIYQLALWTYGIAFVHFVSEWRVFGTSKWGAGLAGPVVVSTASCVWMGLQWGWYVR